MISKIKVKIDNKPYPVPVEMRPLWRISLIIIITKIMNKKNKSLDLKKLNVMLWVLIRTQEWNNFMKFIDDKNNVAPFISSDQANYIAIELGFKKNLLQFNQDKIEVTDLGNVIYDNILLNNLFDAERNFIENYLSKITVDKVEKMLGKN